MSRRELRRSETNRVIAGVAGGMAEAFDIDPVLVRVLWVVAGLMGWGILVYALLWFALPSGPSGGAATIAEERFARGEIDASELDRIRTTLREGR